MDNRKKALHLPRDTVGILSILKSRESLKLFKMTLYLTQHSLKFIQKKTTNTSFSERYKRSFAFVISKSKYMLITYEQIYEFLLVAFKLNDDGIFVTQFVFELCIDLSDLHGNFYACDQLYFILQFTYQHTQRVGLPS